MALTSSSVLLFRDNDLFLIERHAKLIMFLYVCSVAVYDVEFKFFNLKLHIKCNQSGAKFYVFLKPTQLENFLMKFFIFLIAELSQFSSRQTEALVKLS